MVFQTNLARRRVANPKSAEESLDAFNENIPSYVIRAQFFMRKWTIRIGTLLTVMFMFLCFYLPGVLSPFAFSLSGDAQLGRRNMVSGPSPHDYDEVILPWAEWEKKHIGNYSLTTFSGSMINRHLFGKILPQTHNSGVFAKDRGNVARVMIFKLPRSGSTWFTELLNAFPSVFISKEIIQAEFDIDYSIEQRVRHLKRSLLWPTGKMSTGPWGGRFATDYWKAGKWKQQSMKVLGFTVNPIKVLADYQQVLAQRPSAHIVAFIRSNTAKAVVSAVRGSITHKLCGADNLRAEEAVKCKIPRMITIDAAQFELMVYERMVLERRFIEFVYSLKRPVYEVTYEDLQANPQATIMGLMKSFGVVGESALTQQFDTSLRGGHVSESPRSGSAVPTGKADGWVKRSSDDLREHITNFEELLMVLQRVNSPCLESQLRSATPGISFPPCPLPRAWIDRPPT